MKDKEEQLKSYAFLSKEEGHLLAKSLQETLGRTPTEEEIESLLNWAIEIRCGETLIDMIFKDMKSVGLTIDEDSKSGKLIPYFFNTEKGNQMLRDHKEQQEILKEEGNDILKDMLGED